MSPVFCLYKATFMGKTKNKLVKKIISFDIERLKRPLVLMTLIFLMIMVLFIQRTNSEIKKETKLAILPERNVELERKIRNLTDGFPIAGMANQISQKDERTAAFLIAIAKKESNWGLRVPVLNGQDCFNYWGYRGIRERMGSEGHTCFDSRRDAVNTISKRLAFLIQENEIDTPEKLVIWKCGQNCENQDREAVNKWIEDVSFYYDKVVE